MGSRIRVGIITVLALVCPRRADAQEAPAASTVVAPSTTTVEIGGKASFLSPPIRGGTNPFGPGFGGRLGVSFGGFYIGASAIDFLGGTDVDLNAHAVMYGGEAGYGITKSFGGNSGLTLRPTLSAGGVSVMYTTPLTSSTGTTARSRAGTTSTTVNVHPVDVITTASAGRSSSSSSGLFGSDTSNSSTTTVTAFYLQPGATVMLFSSWGFVAVKGTATWVPSISDGLGGSEAWLMWGIDGELGLRF